MPEPLITLTDSGLYCPSGDFYIDPWRPVARAVVTHAHSDHARPGSRNYLAAADGVPLLQLRLGDDAPITGIAYEEAITLGDVRVSLHPAGHMLGAAQVRLESRGQVAVVTGDFKWAEDATAARYAPLRCHLLVTESTFALPIFRWPAVESVVEDIVAWWRSNREQGKASVLLAYSIGKAQRLLSLLGDAVGPFIGHGAILNGCHAYRAAGVDLPPIVSIADAPAGMTWSEALILAPPIAHNSPWLRRFGPTSMAAASGWMRIRGIRRRRTIDRGFVISDHADWDGVLATVDASEAEEVWATHGYTSSLVRYLREQGRNAQALSTQFEGETSEVIVEREDESS